jgi:tRNA/rRNA methyltransferase
MVKPVYTPQAAIAALREQSAAGQKTALVFGAERTGLTNEEVALCHGVINIPLNPDFSSLNLAMAVLTLSYEWFRADDNTEPLSVPLGKTEPASHEKLYELFERLESTLEQHHFFRNNGHKPIMINNLRSMLLRANLTDQEVRTFHGVISALIGNKAPPQ